MPVKSFAKKKATVTTPPVSAPLPSSAPEVRKVTVRLSQAQWEQLTDVSTHDRTMPSLQAIFITGVRQLLRDTKGVSLVD